MDNTTTLPHVFEPRDVESKWYTFWEKQGYFSPPRDSSAPPFCMVIPPPNVTGFLHMGHALNLTLHDILIRWKRMQGYRVLWVPGTDHAGIATQNVVEKQLAKEGLTRHDLGRDKFVERVWEWKETYHARITNQLKSMGASCDWSRERFTMDEGLSRAVKEVFVELFNQGLIYQGEYIVNWCPRCGTAISDVEVEYQDTSSHLYYIHYPLSNHPEEALVVATTRPETMLGDTAVAVNPQDPRYRLYIGKVVLLPLVGRTLPVIADDYVDQTFGTGALKVTPAHDPHDFELGRKHHLPFFSVIDVNGKMNKAAGEYAGLTREKCREAIVQALTEQGYLEKTEPYTHSVGHCYRCQTLVEPLVSKQWFVRMKSLAEPAIQAVEEKAVEFLPERWNRVYFEWMNNIRDWCISRQLWWGHRIPVFTCETCSTVFADAGNPDHCPKCGGKVVQDENVLDTWFSAGLWPFSTLGWPDETPDLNTFYPTSVLVTAFDIIFFWVARMIMMGLRFKGDVPFRTVYITPLVRDAHGKKMSKSTGNAIDPLEVAGKYGADSLRFALAWLTVQGRDINLSPERIEASRNFMNKIWNSSRFVLMNLTDYQPVNLSDCPDLDLKDRWILSRLQRTILMTQEALSGFNFGQYTQLIYDFIWSEFCDWFIEWSKADLYRGTPEKKRKTQNLLIFLLRLILKLLHPVAPFITEEIWQSLPGKETESIMITSWPKAEERWIDPVTERLIIQVQDIIREVRYLRAELSISPAETCAVFLNFTDPALYEVYATYQGYIEQLAKCEIIKGAMDFTKPEGTVTSRTDGVDVSITVAGLIDVEKEKQRLEKKCAILTADNERTRARLENSEFLRKAPSEVVEKDRDRFHSIVTEIKRLRSLIEGIQVS